MTDLDRLLAVAVPRERSLALRYARRLEPIWGFATYAILWLFASVLFAVAGVLAGAGIALAAGLEKGSGTMDAILFGFALFFWALSWWPFIRWARRKRRRAMSLVEHGTLIEGRVATTTGDRALQTAAHLGSRALGGNGLSGVRWYRVAFQHGGAQRFILCPFDSRPEEGTPSPVLFHADSKYAFGFDPSGRAFVGKVHR